MNCSVSGFIVRIKEFYSLKEFFDVQPVRAPFVFCISFSYEHKFARSTCAFQARDAFIERHNKFYRSLSNFLLTVSFRLQFQTWKVITVRRQWEQYDEKGTCEKRKMEILKTSDNIRLPDRSFRKKYMSITTGKEK